MDNAKKIAIADQVIRNVKICYDREQSFLQSVAIGSKTEGEIREAAGKLVENILQDIIGTINSELPNANLISRVGSTDFLSKTIHYKGKEIIFDRIQVDRHVWAGDKRLCFIENKTYLDSCYYDRALADFRKIAQSLAEHGQDPSNCKYIVFSGQNAASSKTLFTYEADFWNDTKHLTSNPNGLETRIFFFLKGKRSSQQPLYRVKHELDIESIRNFVFYLLDILDQRSLL